MTLNNVIYRLQAFAESHKQIQHFYFGDLVDFLAKGEVVYPACFLEMLPGYVGLSDRVANYNFRIWFCDLGDVAIDSQRNEIDVQSDLSAICQDYVAMLDYEARTNSDFNLVNQSFQVEFFREKFEDLVIAAAMNINVASKYNANRCQVPARGVTFTSQTAMFIDNYIHEVEPGEGGLTTLTFSVLKNRKILMLFLGDKLLNPITLDAITGGYTLTTDDYTYNVSSGQFNFGAELQSDPPQILQILNRNL